MFIHRAGLSTRIICVSALCVVSHACSNGSSGSSPGSGGVAKGTGGGSGGTVGSSGASSGGMTGSGGSLGQGGAIGSGGTSERGGASGSGGIAGSSGNPAGGATGVGGASAVDGAVPSGGQVGSGGQWGSGGQLGSGGRVGSGGRPGSGGQAGSAGSFGSGGATSTGGSSAASCPSPALASGNTTHTMQLDGKSRTYVLHVPAGYTGKTAVPLLVDFHPHGSTGPDWQTSSPYPKVVDGDGVVSAYPSAVGDWDVGPCCADGVDDVEFARAVVKEVEGLACIDAKRVYAAGFSMGGGMTNYVACHAADVFAAFAPAAFDLLQEVLADCKPSRPITVVSFRGTADSYVPYDGGVSNLVKPITFLGAVNTMKKWAEFSGCTGSAADEGNGCQGYAASQCQAGVEVVLCTKQGGGHEAANASLTWPVLKRHTLP